jgi:hypothetical protein
LFKVYHLYNELLKVVQRYGSTFLVYLSYVSLVLLGRFNHYPFKGDCIFSQYSCCNCYIVKTIDSNVVIKGYKWTSYYNIENLKGCIKRGWTSLAPGAWEGTRTWCHFGNYSCLALFVVIYSSLQTGEPLMTPITKCLNWKQNM